MWESCLGASEIPKNIAQSSCPLQGLQHSCLQKGLDGIVLTGGRICPTNAVKITSQTVSPCVSCVERLICSFFSGLYFDGAKQKLPSRGLVDCP